ncbi:MAG: SCO family protein [Deltaproteobacteria bacterium]|nr:SCO family protein [Deltaproteobacteria bacterium]
MSLVVWALFMGWGLAPVLAAGGEGGRETKLKPFAIEPEAPGTRAPDFSLKGLDGREWTMSELKGKVVVLNFWATWCIPCLEEFPQLQNLHKTLGGQNFILLAVNVMDKRSRIEAFLKDKGYDFPIALDEKGDVYRSYGVKNFPATIVVDHDGNIHGRALGARQWDSPEALKYFLGMAARATAANSQGGKTASQPEKYQNLNLRFYDDKGGDFAMQDHEGRPSSLKDFRGQVLLVGFGYTHCPDICPTMLSSMVGVDRLLPQTGDRLRFMFVTLDPGRDTAEHLKGYLEYFGERFVGMTGTEEQVAAAARKYKVRYKSRQVGGELGYLIDHSAFVFLVDQEGRLRFTFPHNSDPEYMAEGVRRLLGS